ncbi:MAG: hypothetical protein ACRC41_11295 [Sarcina sp.]
MSKKIKFSKGEYSESVKRVNPNILPLEEYINAKTKLMHRCIKHNIEWSVLPSSILSGAGCRICKKEKLSDTSELYIDKLKGINKNINCIEEYINNKTPIKHKCLIDNYIWKARPGDILSGHGCPKCGGCSRRTHEEYVEELYSINPNIEVLETYINKEVPIKHKCIIDGYEWKVIPHNLLRGSKCPRCSKVERYTTEEFIKILKVINPNVEILESYIKSSLPIKAKCLIDNHIWNIRPGDLLSGYGCPRCGVVKRSLKQEIGYEEFLKRMDLIHKGKIRHIGEYINLKVSTEFECTIDNYRWIAKPSNVIHNETGCPICANNMKYSTKKFIEFMEEINKSIEILGAYKGKEQNIKCRCKICNHIWNPRAGNLKNRKSTCPRCSKKISGEARRLSEEEFLNRIFKINPKLEVIGKFYLTSKKILVRCKCCEYKWDAMPRDLLYAESGCPQCAATQIESKLASLVKSLALRLFADGYIGEYKECINPKTGYPLPYDICINYNGKKYLLEIHGPQHERYIPYFHRKGIRDFDYQCWKDNYKKEWAISKGYIYKCFWVEYDSIEDIEKYFNNLGREISLLS